MQVPVKMSVSVLSQMHTETEGDKEENIFNSIPYDRTNAAPTVYRQEIVRTRMCACMYRCKCWDLV